MATKKGKTGGETAENKSRKGGKYKCTLEKVRTGLDPKLQGIVLSVKGKAKPETTAAYHGLDENAEREAKVDVIAKLKDPGQTVPNLAVVRTIGQIVTGIVGAG